MEDPLGERYGFMAYGGSVFVMNFDKIEDREKSMAEIVARQYGVRVFVVYSAKQYNYGARFHYENNHLCLNLTNAEDRPMPSLEYVRRVEDVTKDATKLRCVEDLAFDIARKPAAKR